MRLFSYVSPAFRKTSGDLIKPTRATKKSCAYDFYAPKNYIVQPNETVKIWTDIKANMEDDEVLLINVRSSMGGIWRLANTQGWIDADYYGNVKNDGNIGIFLTNISDEVQTIAYGDRIAQGMFVKYLVTDDDNAKGERIGGFGSTN